MKILTVSFILVVAMGLSGCGNEKNPAPQEEVVAKKPVVVVPVPPYAGLVKRIAGDSVEIETLVGVGKDPHYFSPTPRQVARVNQAAVYFTVGMPFEADLIASLKESTTDLKIIDLTKGVEMLELEHDCVHHDHGHDGEHEGEHEGIEVTASTEAETTEVAEVDHDHAAEDDPHIWLSPVLLQKQLAVLHPVLEMITGQNHSGAVHKNSEQLEAELSLLDYDLASKLKPYKGQAFYVYHGAFGYFASAYGLKQIPIEVGGKSPEPKHLAELIAKAKAEKVKMIFVQPQFDQTAAKTIAEAIGGTVVAIDPLEEDVVANLRSIAEKVIASKE